MSGVLPITDKTKQFAIRIVKDCTFIYHLPGVCRTLSKQLLGSGTSIGVNIRESLSAQSDKDFLSKMEIALKEARETQYWLEILIDSGVVEPKKFNRLLQQANEIGKILVASTQKLKQQ